MTEVVVVHHFHDLQHAVVGGHSHQPLSWGHHLTHMNTCGALALDHHLGQVICGMNSYLSINQLHFLSLGLIRGVIRQ